MFVPPRKRRRADASQLSPSPFSQSRPHSTAAAISVTAVTANSQLDLLTNDAADLIVHPSTPAQLDGVQHQDAASSNRPGDAKRRYSCRVCGIKLSSASNRVRHERAKHKESDWKGGAAPSAQASTSSSATQTVGCKRSSALSDAGNTQLTEDCQPPLHEDDSESDSPGASASAESEDEESHSTTQRAESNTEMDHEFELPTPMLDLSTCEGLRPMLREEDLQTHCYSFLVWLSQPPVTQSEALVKARRIKSMQQLQPIKYNLRFIFALLYEREAIMQVDLDQLKRLSLCQTLFQAMSDRQVGSARIHAVFLLLKKVLIYLSSLESSERHQFVQASAYESFFFVDSICSDSSHRRKQESRNRALLGVQQSQLLHKSQPMLPHQAFVVPKQWGGGAPLKAANIAEASMGSPPASSHISDQAPSNELNKTELQQVAKGCVAFLNAHLPPHAPGSMIMTSLPDDRLFMAHLVTATLCLGLAPRSQILKQLRIGSSFAKQTDDRYWVKILAEMSKNGKPTMFAISAQLTAAFDHYLDIIRPRLLAQGLASARSESDAPHDYVFVKRNGTAPRADFSTCTCLITQTLIGRPVNAHAFRAAVVTAFYETGASQSEMDVLATIMAHDPTTAKNFYYRPQIAAAAVQTNDKMAELLLQ